MLVKSLRLTCLAATCLLFSAALAEGNNRHSEMCIAFESEVLAEMGPAVITQLEMDASLALIPDEHRGAFMLNRNRLGERLDQLLVSRLMVADALNHGLTEDPLVQAKVHHAVVEVLASLWRERRQDSQETDFEEHARERYLSNPDMFRAPPSLDFDHILISAEGRTAGDAARAILDLYDQLAAGADYDTLRARWSEDPSQPEGGFQNAAIAELDRAFAAALENVPADGSVIGPVQTRHGWHLVRLHARHPGRQLSWEEVREGAIADTRRRHLERSEQRYRQQLIHDQELVIPPGAIETLFERYGLSEFFEPAG